MKKMSDNSSVSSDSVPADVVAAKERIFAEIEKLITEMREFRAEMREFGAEMREECEKLSDDVRGLSNIFGELSNDVSRNSRTLDAIVTKAMEGNGLSFPATARPPYHSRIRLQHEDRTIPAPYAG